MREEINNGKYIPSLDGMFFFFGIFLHYVDQSILFCTKEPNLHLQQTLRKAYRLQHRWPILTITSYTHHYPRPFSSHSVGIGIVTFTSWLLLAASCWPLNLLLSKALFLLVACIDYIYCPFQSSICKGDCRAELNQCYEYFYFYILFTHWYTVCCSKREPSIISLWFIIHSLVFLFLCSISS